MATDVLSQTNEGSATADDPAEGWIDRILGLPERLPGPALLWCVCVFLVLMLAPSALIWLVGSQPVGQIDPRIWLPALISAYVVGFIDLLDGIARRAFGDFESALGDRSDKSSLEASLTSIPDRLALPFIVLAEIIVTVGYFSDQAELDHMLSRPLTEMVVILVVNWFAIGLVATLIVHTVLQLRMVDRLHRMATTVDLLNAGPAHAFARLTSATGIGFVVLGVLVLGDPTAGRETLFYAAEAAGVILFAAAAFGLPLRGMHDRMAVEKARLLRATNDRTKLVLARIHDSVDADDLERSDRLNASLSSLLAERDLISRLSTWPWSASTIRGFASALFLPLLIWAITRILERVV